MQLCTIELGLGGSFINTVVKQGVTPAEILVLQYIHGEGSVRNVRPGKIDRTRRHASEFDRLAGIYDRASMHSGAPGEERKSIMGTLFPGIVRKLPVTLKEVGLGHFEAKASIEAANLAMTAKPDPAEVADPVAPDVYDEQADDGPQADEPDEFPVQEDA